MIGTTLNQRFSVEKELGRGGMGAVYRASDTILQRSVAIKVLKDGGDPEVSKKIRLEAQILARLLHDNVVRLYDFGEAQGTCFLVMEEVDGTSYLKRWRELGFQDRLRVVAQVADALDYAHRQGVIHRDVKPANVLMTSQDQPKLSDFGLSSTLEDAQETRTIRGTPQYMSPEQAQGKRLDHRTDLYSLGVMLYESASGTVPFAGKSLAVMSQHMNSQPEPPRARNAEISKELDALILQLLAKEPERRPVSGAAVAAAIRAELERAANERNSLNTQAVTRVIDSSSSTEAMTANGSGSQGPGSVGVTTQYTSVGSAAPAPAPSPAAAVPAPVVKPQGLVPSLLETVQGEPMILSPDERFLCGHYLAYLLGGSRRQGIFMRRPLDPRNADRARLLLAMTSIMLADGSDESIARGAELLDSKIDVRPLLSPMVVAKYLVNRDSVAKRKRFRKARTKLLEASSHAKKAMLDGKGVLNPGLMPSKLDDLRKLAPERVEVDDELVTRWNRVSDIWRTNHDFRNAVLLYATRHAASDPASYELWPEVVYPLIERARWQRRMRTRTEALWDNVCDRVLRIPDAGVRLDRAIRVSVPTQVIAHLDISLEAFDENPLLDDDAATADSRSHIERLTIGVGQGAAILQELADGPGLDEPDLIYLADPNPYRFTLGDLRGLWEESIAAMRSREPKSGHRLVPVGPYRLVVIPSIRGRSAGQVAIQGMPNKQIEMLTPSIRLGSSGSKPFIAAWVYEDNSMAIAYLDFKGSESYIHWHAATAQQTNFTDPGSLNHLLFSLGMEVPDQLDRVLTKRFRPQNPV